ncbi:hypothetical protein GCM10020358_75750 [Amorphoplanes nipponensis]|uniref:Uncharacterized protein n=1 Tax=Actinoplanes nipponensis TaxID=135950 RepID=A0A919MMN2_9ACTN|nr:hypothetical protein Ani05nite_35960 [Actinoplanes nipponensis]
MPFGLSRSPWTTWYCQVLRSQTYMNRPETAVLAVIANFTWYVAAARAGAGASTRARTTTTAAAAVRKILTIRPQ